MSSDGSSYMSNPDIRPIWLESTLQSAPAPVPPPPAKAPRRRWIWWFVLLVVGVGGWFSYTQLRRSPTALLHEGWGAYRARDYASARQALTAAEAQAPDLDGISELRAALAVGPALDTVEQDIEAGRPVSAKVRLETVLKSAPEDVRALRIARALERAQPTVQPPSAPARRP